MADSMTPQFQVTLPVGSSFGTEVMVNGTALHNVVSVEVDNKAAVDDLIVSSITIHLGGEPVLVTMGPGGVSKV
jgi:hypothetical protein